MLVDACTKLGLAVVGIRVDSLDELDSLAEFHLTQPNAMIERVVRALFNVLAFEIALNELGHVI